MAHGAAREMWAFDSFAGLPPAKSVLDEHPRWKTGAMRESRENFCSQIQMDGIDMDYVHIVEGFYDQSLQGKNAEELPSDIALAWIDCDMYSSAAAVFQFLESHLKHGMILAVDDYFCYSAGSISGERLAFLEFVTRAVEFAFCPYVQFGWHGLSFIVEKSEFLPGGLRGLQSC